MLLDKQSLGCNKFHTQNYFDVFVVVCLVIKPKDKLSEQKHLRLSIHLCVYRNSIIDHAISDNTKTAT